MIEPNYRQTLLQLNASSPVFKIKIFKPPNAKKKYPVLIHQSVNS
jgi:hypothetical protein